MSRSIADFVRSQREWSEATFGPGARTEGNCRHIEKELTEVRANPTDLSEWIDIATLALDGAWRAGWSPEEIEQGIWDKHQINRARKWPVQNGQDQPVEHFKDSA